MLSYVTPKRIPLSAVRRRAPAGYTLVDADVAEWAGQWNWELLRYKNKRYAIRRVTRAGQTTTIYLHREILGLPHHGRDPQVDHQNGDGLDNRRENLRTVTHAQNQQNMKMHCDNTSGYRGVSWSKQNKKWETYATLNGKRYTMGMFSSIEDARLAVTAWRRIHMPFSVEPA